MSNLFRARAVSGQAADRVLDEPVHVVSLPAWIGLILGFIVLTGGVIWLGVGTVDVRLSATGVVTNAPENTLVTASQAGTLIDVRAQRDQPVRNGDVLAQISSAGTDGLSAIVSPIDGL